MCSVFHGHLVSSHTYVSCAHFDAEHCIPCHGVIKINVRRHSDRWREISFHVLFSRLKMLSYIAKRRTKHVSGLPVFHRKRRCLPTQCCRATVSEIAISTPVWKHWVFVSTHTHTYTTSLLHRRRNSREKHLQDVTYCASFVINAVSM